MGTLGEKRAAREEKLVAALRNKKHMDTGEVVSLLGISESTARRFFDDLEKKGVVLRTYGGIQISPELDADYYFEDLQQKQTTEKKRIGEYASRLVEDGDIIFMDSGTTLQHMAVELAQRIKEGELRDLQIYTNSLINLKILMPYNDVHVIGGLFRNKRQDFCGYLAEMVLSNIVFKKSFLGADGISMDAGEGIMATDVFTARADEITAQRTDKMFLLADSTKFMRRSFIKYATLDAVDLFITDTSLSDEYYNLFIESGLEVARV